MKEKPVDQRTRWVYHVTCMLVVGQQISHLDTCVTINFRMDHENNIAALRQQIVGGIEVSAADDKGVPVVGARIVPRCIFTQTPRLLRTFLSESEPHHSMSPVLVQ